MGLAIAVKPARVAPGTRLAVSMRFNWDGKGKGDYSFAVGGRGDGVSLYPIPPAQPGTIPTGTPVLLPGTSKEGTYTVTVPANTVLKPGRYLVSPVTPPAATRVTVRGKDVSLSSVGAYSVGSLPVVTVLPGPATPPATVTPGPSSSRPNACRTIIEREGGKIRSKKIVC